MLNLKSIFDGMVGLQGWSNSPCRFGPWIGWRACHSTSQSFEVWGCDCGDTVCQNSVSGRETCRDAWKGREKNQKKKDETSQWLCWAFSYFYDWNEPKIDLWFYCWFPFLTSWDPGLAVPYLWTSLRMLARARLRRKSRRRKRSLLLRNPKDPRSRRGQNPRKTKVPARDPLPMD